ncbi:EAL domain-containing protein [Brevibacterium sp. 50QC2O2]|uniref:EAL domain-containing protein n=1 Tax=Brevibacterium TaxID=1696 RepID=UPI00211CE36A|nr:MULTISPECIES: EAL domain-containing protein [unclassified Brevibacterium]MCQ9369378.1 EAL domain-containing protein [Brevibacterium sp. 91QC2O2]MCQ9386731.1 EAL domain-containing protein [Brevibacterium sp. 68QC2CO]MCQ9389687.1 EAL domain-containing protein [Brevibacterium sp. 50QC2O2]
MTGPGPHVDEQTAHIERLIRSGLVDTYFAPVIDHMTGQQAGYRLQHVDHENPQPDMGDTSQLRRAVRDSPMVGDFDASFRASGLRAAEAAGLPRHTRLFVTAEPASLALLEDRTDEPERSVILQLDPASIARDPAVVLRSVRQARTLGWGIGVRSVGLTSETLGFIPVVNPSVVSLHRDVLQIRDPHYLAELTHALMSHVERTGAVILAEGVETEADLELVDALGARFVSGSLYGALSATPEPVASPPDDPVSLHTTRNALITGTPYSVAQGLGRDPLVMGEELLAAHMETVLSRAQSTGGTGMCLAVFADDEDLTAPMADRLIRLRDSCGFVGVFAGGLREAPVPGVRSAPLDDSDALRGEYCVLLLAADGCSMISAHRMPNPGSDGRTEYEAYVTRDVHAVVDAAKGLLTRLRPEA